MRRAAAWVCAACVATSCTPAPVETEPPLRPLLYTEAPAGVEQEIPGFEAWTDPRVDPTAWPTEHATRLAGEVALNGGAETPEALVLDAFEAMASGDEARLLGHTFEPADLAVASRMGASTAESTAAEIREGTIAALRLLAVRGSAGAPTPGQLTIGQARTVDGGVAEEGTDGVMHWGNELTFVDRASGLEFVVRFPNLLRDASGTWRLRAAPTLDGRYVAYRNNGLDMMPTLMDSEHAPMPLSVGNYWHYRSRDPSGETAGVGQLRSGGFRDSVVEVNDHGGYRVARLRRVHDDPNQASEHHALLVTPSRLYRCDRECTRRAHDAEWVLGYLRRSTPLFVFPLPAGGGWGAGGSTSSRDAWRVSDSAVSVTVPAGVFPDAFELSRSASRGRETVAFVPGIGVVSRRVSATAGATIEELVEYRILP